MILTVGIVVVIGATVCASSPLEIPKPSEISEVFQKVGYFRFLEMVPRGGIEPPTRGFSIHCSTN